MAQTGQSDQLSISTQDIQLIGVNTTDVTLYYSGHIQGLVMGTTESPNTGIDAKRDFTIISLNTISSPLPPHINGVTYNLYNGLRKYGIQRFIATLPTKNFPQGKFFGRHHPNVGIGGPRPTTNPQYYVTYQANYDGGVDITHTDNDETQIIVEMILQPSTLVHDVAGDISRRIGFTGTSFDNLQISLFGDLITLSKMEPTNQISGYNEGDTNA